MAMSNCRNYKLQKLEVLNMGIVLISMLESFHDIYENNFFNDVLNRAIN